MRKYIFLLASVAVLASCGNKAETERLQHELDSLKNVNSDANAEIDSYIGDLNDIQENLDQIKQKEGIISVTSSTGGELSEDSKTKIQNDIALIQQLMDENKAKIDALNKKIKKGDVKAKELEKLIANMQKSIEEKDQEIAGLKGQLEKLNIDLANLTSSYDSLNVENTNNKSTIESQTNELNTVYYAMGTFKELTDNKVLDKGGAFSTKSGAKLSSDVNIDYFTKGDKRNITEIKIGSKKATLKTSHPKDSYKMETVNGKVEKLVITDANKFWQNSKYCVIVLN
jgi:DNA repair exonuclease SbcCD ATPase subunit